MSRILDGLKKTQGDAARLTLQVLGEDLSRRLPGTAEDSAPVNDRPAVLARSRALESELPSADLDVEYVRSEPDSVSPRSDELAEEPGQGPDHVGWPLPGLERLSDGPDETLTVAPSQDEQRQFAPGSQLGLGGMASAVRSVKIRLRPGAPLLPFEASEAEGAAEQYRRVRTHIIQDRLRPRLMLVSSPAAGDGKSVTALNVSGALALNRDSSVLLVDMDLRRPTIASLLGVPETPGVSDVLEGSTTIENAIVRLDPFPNLYLLPAGGRRSNPTELLSSPQWRDLCGKLRSWATYTIFDGPPVDAVAEYKLLEEPVDGLILVMRTDCTARPLLQSALESIPREKLIGGIVNDYRPASWNKNSYYTEARMDNES